MISFWKHFESFFTGKCLYYSYCSLYRKDSITCNQDVGLGCGACRNFDEVGKASKNYKDSV